MIINGDGGCSFLASYRQGLWLKLVSLIQRSAAIWRYSAFIAWTEKNLAVTAPQTLSWYYYLCNIYLFPVSIFSNPFHCNHVCACMMTGCSAESQCSAWKSEASSCQEDSRQEEGVKCWDWHWWHSALVSITDADTVVITVDDIWRLGVFYWVNKYSNK